MTKDEIEYKAYLFFKEKGLEYVDNIDELIGYCRDFAYPIVSYFEEKIADLKETNAILSESATINQKDLEYKVSVIEQRNKRIAELEQELQDLKDRHAEEIELHLHAEDYIKSLEKENAELKKWQKDTIKARGNDYMDWCRMKDQLTKAKEIIKDLLEYSKEHWLYSDIKKQAEQFLKEIEKC